MAKYKVKAGKHREGSNIYGPGQVLESDKDLMDMFANKFEKVEDSATVSEPMQTAKKQAEKAREEAAAKAKADSEAKREAAKAKEAAAEEDEVEEELEDFSEEFGSEDYDVLKGEEGYMIFAHGDTETMVSGPHSSKAKVKDALKELEA